MRILFGFLAVYFLTVVQTSICPLLEIYQVTPDLLLLMPAFIVVSSNSPYRFLWGGWIGLIHDLITPGPLGLAMFAFALAGYLITRIQPQLYSQHSLIRFGMISLTIGISIALLTALRILFQDYHYPWAHWPGLVAGVTLYTSTLSVPLILLTAKSKHPHLSTF